MNSSNKLRTMSMGKLLFTMSVPAIISMLILSLYNIVDSIFVSKISDLAFNAVNLAFPMQMLIVAFALGIGIGSSSLIARKMGERKPEEANQIAKTGIFLSLIGYLLFIIIGLFLTEPYLRLMTDNEEIIKMGKSYLQICMFFSFGVFFEVTASKILQGTGNMIIPMITQLIGAIINIILDPIFIFTLGFGVRGAAIATVIGQIVSMLFVFAYFFFKTTEVNISFKGFKLKWKNVTAILQLGIPITVMNSIASLTTTSMNYLLSNYSATEEIGVASVNVIGVYFKLQNFIFMPIFGLNQGGMPILAYNYGANIRKRFDQALRLILIAAVAIVSFGLVLFQLFPQFLLSLFDASEDMITIGRPALRIISLCFIPASFSIIYSMTFQSLGKGIKSMFMSLFRQLIILIPVASLFAIVINIDYIWVSYPIAELVTALIFVPMAIVTVNKEFKEKELEEIATNLA